MWLELPWGTPKLPPERKKLAQSFSTCRKHFVAPYVTPDTEMSTSLMLPPEDGVHLSHGLQRSGAQLPFSPGTC